MSETKLPDIIERIRTLLAKSGDERWAVEYDDRPGMESNNHIVLAEDTPKHPHKWPGCRIAFMAHDGPKKQDEFNAKAELIAVARNALPVLLAEITRLRERLEMTHAWQLIDGKMQKVAVEPGSIPDGIDCRDETIKLQDAELTRLRSHAGWHEAIEAAAKVAEEWADRATRLLTGDAADCAHLPTSDEHHRGVFAMHINRDRLLQMLDNYASGMYQAIGPEVVAEAARQLRNSIPIAEDAAAEPELASIERPEATPPPPPVEKAKEQT